MADTPAQIITALQTRHAAITGVTNAPTVMPASLNAADLPLVLVFPAASIVQDLEPHTFIHNRGRSYVVRVYVKPLAQGRGIDEGFQDALTLLPLFDEGYRASNVLSGLTATLSSYSDTGIQPQTFGEVSYHGFAFTLQISESC